jgi:hypothetical protein
MALITLATAGSSLSIIASHVGRNTEQTVFNNYGDIVLFVVPSHIKRTCALSSTREPEILSRATSNLIWNSEPLA